MTREYSLFCNPFIDGLLHKPYYVSENSCGITAVSSWSYSFVRQDFVRQDLEGEGFSPRNYVFKDDNGRLIDRRLEPDFSKCERYSYYLGRTVRFIVNIPLAICVVALQVLFILSNILKLVGSILEARIRRCSIKETLVYKISNIAFLNNLYFRLENNTNMVITYLARDLRIVDELTIVKALHDKYFYMMYEKRFYEG